MAWRFELASLPWACAVCNCNGKLLQSNLLWLRRFGRQTELESCLTGAAQALHRAATATATAQDAQIFQCLLGARNGDGATLEPVVVRFSAVARAAESLWLVAVHPDGDEGAAADFDASAWDDLRQAVEQGEIDQQQDGVAQRVLARHWQAIFHDAAAGKALVGVRDETLDVNPALCALLGRSQAELLSLFGGTLRHPDDFNRVDDYFRAVESGAGAPPYIEARYLHRDGHYLDCLLKLSAVRDSRGRALYFIAEFEDISARRAAEARLHAQARELARSNAELEHFAFVASHDLQEPLRKIRVFGDRLRAQLQAEGAAAENPAQDAPQDAPNEELRFLDGMTRSAERMQLLIDDLLQYARLQAQPSHFETVDLGEVWRELLDDFEVALRDGGRVEVGALPRVQGERTRLRQLFGNLLSNALKFRGAAAALVRVRWLNPGAAESGELVQIEVSDNGIGFEAAQSEAIFEVFRRLHARSQFSGTGIGLALCRHIAREQGGDIVAQGEPGQGARFVVSLKRVASVT